jgi:type IV pilus assembly protein PilM
MAAPVQIGLDIGSSSVRAVQTTRGKGAASVTAFGQAELPVGAVRAGTVHDAEAVILAIKSIWTEKEFRSKQVILGVSSHQAVVREVTLPELAPKERRQALPHLVADMLPMAAESALLDFYPIGAPEQGQQRGLLIAAPREQVANTVAVVERAGLTVARVDLSSFAVLRAAARPGDEREAIVDLGARSTTVLVHTDGIPHLVRTVPRGGSDVTAAIAAGLALPEDEAEAVKRRVGVLADEDPWTTDVVADALRPLVHEIRSSLAYLAGSAGSAPVTRLGLCGGGALMPGLTAYLADELDVDVYLADPLMRVGSVARRGAGSELSVHRCAAAVSVGLTLLAAS